MEISHCPFDGGNARVFESNHFASTEMFGKAGPRSPRYRITCLKCKAFGPSKETPEDAVLSWNTRRLFPNADDAGVSSGLG